MPYCRNCGEALGETDATCANCGATQEVAESAEDGTNGLLEDLGIWIVGMVGGAVAAYYIAGDPMASTAGENYNLNFFIVLLVIALAIMYVLD